MVGRLAPAKSSGPDAKISWRESGRRAGGVGGGGGGGGGKGELEEERKQGYSLTFSTPQHSTPSNPSSSTLPSPYPLTSPSGAASPWKWGGSESHRLLQSQFHGQSVGVVVDYVFFSLSFCGRLIICLSLVSAFFLRVYLFHNVLFEGLYIFKHK